MYISLAYNSSAKRLIIGNSNVKGTMFYLVANLTPFIQSRRNSELWRIATSDRLIRDMAYIT
jgi:hypothetical protein